MTLDESASPGARQARALMDEYLDALGKAGEREQAVVGQGLDMASGLLRQEFASVSAYREAGREAQSAFLERLDSMVKTLEPTHVGVAWGFRLFWIYSRLLLEDDPQVASAYWPRLRELVEKGLAHREASPGGG
jgi:hypothetical protein